MPSRKQKRSIGRLILDAVRSKSRLRERAERLQRERDTLRHTVELRDDSIRHLQEQLTAYRQALETLRLGHRLNGQLHQADMDRISPPE